MRLACGGEARPGIVVSVASAGNLFAMTLRGLAVHDADPVRVERLRARCLAALTAQRPDGHRRRMAGWAWLEPALALGPGALYVAAATANAVALLR